MKLSTVKLACLTWLALLPHVVKDVSAADFLIDPFVGAGAASDVYNVQINDKFWIATELDRSYACSFVPLSYDPDDFFTFIVDSKIVDVNGEYPASSVPFAPPYISRTFVPTTSGLGALQVLGAADGGEQVRVDCRMTSLFGGYNTILNPINFLEITNLAGGEVEIVIDVVRSDDTVLVNDVVLKLGRQQRFDFDIHGSIGNEASYGTIILNHNGPFGAISAQVSQYAIVDGQLRQTAIIPLKTRYAQ